MVESGAGEDLPDWIVWYRSLTNKEKKKFCKQMDEIMREEVKKEIDKEILDILTRNFHQENFLKGTPKNEI